MESEKPTLTALIAGLTLLAFNFVRADFVHAAPQESPLIASVCQFYSVPRPPAYEGRDLSVKGRIFFEEHGTYLIDLDCPNSRVELRFLNTQVGSVADLLNLLNWANRSTVTVSSPYCICVGRIANTGFPILFVERVEEIWIPKL